MTATTYPHAAIRDFDPERLATDEGLAEAIRIVFEDHRRGCFGEPEMGMTYLNVRNVIENSLGVEVKVNTTKRATRFVGFILEVPGIERFERWGMYAYRLAA